MNAFLKPFAVVALLELAACQKSAPRQPLESSTSDWSSASAEPLPTKNVLLPTGRFQGVQSGSSNAVFIIDTTTGAVQWCHPGSPDGMVICGPANFSAPAP